MKQEESPLDENSLEQAHRVAYLIAGHIRKILTTMERRELDGWLEESEKNIELFEELTDEAHMQQALDWYARLDQEKALNRVKQRIGFTPPQKSDRPPYLSISIAACLVLALSAAVYWLAVNKNQPAPVQVMVNSARPVERGPGGTKAVLVLADGSRMVLDSLGNGALAVQGNTQVVKSDSALSYRSAPQVGITQQPVYNVLQTPRGGQYKVTLSDGTLVWLNAASSLRYPTAFTGKERMVELTGEAYFEVVHQSSQPFKVKAGGVVIEDLGTSFNVNSYNDEGVLKTTLVEGAVKVVKDGHWKVLKPGQEALVGDGAIQVVKADIESAVGWKEGEFVFRGTPIATVMKHLERWYGIEIQNKETNTNHLVATIKRDVPLSRMLYYLEKTGEVHFRWKDKNLIVLP